MKISFKKILSLIILVSALFLPFAVLALENNYDFLGLGANPSLEEFAATIINYIISISAMLGGLAIVIGGVLWIISGLRGGSNSEAKDWIKSGVLGLFLLTGAYIILSTINPALVNPKIGKLLNVIPFVGTHVSDLNGPQKIYYKEIPMGTLTETVLAKTINCYDFDDMGDPIKGGNGPTLLNHDRADCLLKLNGAIEKKSKIIKNLSTKIAELMEKCSCSKNNEEANDCKKMDSENCPFVPPNTPPENCNETGVNCGSGLKCECEGGNPGACETDPNEFKLCPAGVKNQVQKGPIVLDNFDIGPIISSQPGNNDSLSTCITDKGPTQKKYKGLEEFNDDGLSSQAIIDLVEYKIEIDGKEEIAINKQNWDNLRLVQQLIYLKEKLKQIATTLSQDSKNLEKAVDELNNCYLATPYVDLLKKIEQTDKNHQIIMVQKNFNPYQNKFTDISKYCNGFGYENSSCYYNCDNMCPVTSDQSLACIASCQNQGNDCLVQNDCFGTRPCPNSLSGDFSDFNGCMLSCQKECSKTCEEEYAYCQKTVKACEQCKEEEESNIDCNKIGCIVEFKKCKDRCKSNSECVLNNKEKCLYNPNDLIKKCSGLESDQENIKNCIDNVAYTCKYGSDIRAGYADCLEKPYSLQNKFSSSDIFKAQWKQKCPDPYLVDTSSPCYSAKSPNKKCGESCPEVSKCPSASKCPQCPCSTLYSGDIITDYRVVGGECQTYKYNDDPLTFYCKNNWWSDESLKNEEIKPNALTNKYVCPKNNEIPIGQTVDNTQSWAKKLLKYEAEFIQKTDELIKRLKEISDQKDYCQCGSLCDDTTGERACNAPCLPALEDTVDEYGNVIEEKCVCAPQSCKGNPCQKMINLLLGKNKSDKCPKNEIIIGAVQIYPQIKAKLDVIKDFIVKSRTEIIKELIYSRNKINDCSSESKANTVADQTKLISCTRVNNNFISPIAGTKTILNGKEVDFPCYGKTLGKLFSNSATNYETLDPSDPSYIKPDYIEPETDNWFCCVPH